MPLRVHIGAPAPLVAAGVGRSVDLYFPNLTGPVQVGAGMPVGTRARGGLAGAAMGTGQVGGLTSLLVQEYKGAWCADLHTAVSAGSVCRVTMPLVVEPVLVAPVAAMRDAGQCWRIIARLALGANPGAAIGAQDCGLCLAYNNSADPYFAGVAFIGLYFTGPQQVSLIVRAQDTAGLTVNIAVPAALVADVRDWHDYELRLVSATPGVQAQLKAYVDGVLVGQVPFDGVQLLQTYKTSGNSQFPGLVPHVINCVSNAVTDLYLHSFMVQGADTEAGLL